MSLDLKDKLFRIFKHQLLLVGFGISGLVLVIFGMLTSFDAIQRFWASLLIANWYFLCLSIFGIVFVSIHYITKSNWAKRILPLSISLSSFLPICSFLFLFLFFGLNSIYDWPNAEIGNKDYYLNLPFLLTRTVIILIIWNYFYFRFQSALISNSTEISKEKIKQNSVLFILIFLVTFTVLCWDWLMALDTDFHSTIFPIYHISGLLSGGSAFLILIISTSKKTNSSNKVDQNLSYDLGRFLLAFCMIWFYVWICQLLIIWYGNIPAESQYFTITTEGSLKHVFIFNLILNFVIPFILLLHKRIKQNLTLLSLVAIIVLLGRLVDYYLCIMPFAMNGNVNFGIIETGVFIFIGSIFLIVIKRQIVKV